MAIANVILFHAVGWGFTAMFAWQERYLPDAGQGASLVGTLPYYGLRLIEQLVAFTINAFVFVSGYFIAFSTGRARETVEWKVIRARLRHLLFPYLFWTALVWLGFAVQGRILAPLDYARLLLSGATNPAYYYVPLLMQLYLVAPFIVPLTKKHWRLLLAGTAIVQLGVYLIQYGAALGPSGAPLGALGVWVPKWFFPTRLFWFALGAVFGLQLAGLRPVLERMRWPLLAVAAALFVVGFVEWEILLRLSGKAWIETRETLVDGLYSAAVLLAFLGFVGQPLPFSRQLSELGTKSYGIYLIHSPVMEYLARGLYHAAPWVLAHQILLLPLLIVFGLGIPLVLMALVSRSPARRLYAYQFG